MRLVVFAVVCLLAAAPALAGFADMCPPTYKAPEKAGSDCPQEFLTNDPCLLKKCFSSISIPAMGPIKKQATTMIKGVEQLAPVDNSPIGSWDILRLRQNIVVFHGGILSKKTPTGAGEIMGGIFLSNRNVASDYSRGAGNTHSYAIGLKRATQWLLINTNNIEMMIKGGLHSDSNMETVRKWVAETGKAVIKQDQMIEGQPGVNDYWECQKAEKCKRVSETSLDRDAFSFMCNKLPNIEGVIVWVNPCWQEIYHCGRTKLAWTEAPLQPPGANSDCVPTF